jgi:elongator complex protein 3
MIKIYPLMVMPKTKLYLDYKKGLFKPIDTSQAAEIISEFLPRVEPYCRVMRVQRDIPTYRIIDGVDKTNLRQYVDILMKKKQLRSRDIRAREIGRNTSIKTLQPKLKVQEYIASKGQEYFISFEDEDQNIIIGFCRLRFPSQQLRKEFTPTTAIIRELHVYGQALHLGTREEDSSQHKGFGKKLLEKAEEISRQNGYDKLLVISGVGVREYYKNLGYEREGVYMSKSL